MTGMREAIGIAAEMQSRRICPEAPVLTSGRFVGRQIRQDGVKVAVAVPVAEQ
jgi:hypothetical protein